MERLKSAVEGLRGNNNGSRNDVDATAGAHSDPASVGLGVLKKLGDFVEQDGNGWATHSVGADEDWADEVNDVPLVDADALDFGLWELQGLGDLLGELDHAIVSAADANVFDLGEVFSILFAEAKVVEAVRVHAVKVIVLSLN